MTETILLPCPWCGKADALAKDLARGPVQFERIACDRCGVSGPPAYEGHDAAVLWNARVAQETKPRGTQRRRSERASRVWSAARIAALRAQVSGYGWFGMGSTDVLSLLDELEQARAAVRIKNAELSLTSEWYTKSADELAEMHARVAALRNLVNQPVPDDEYWR